MVHLELVFGLLVAICASRTVSTVVHEANLGDLVVLPCPSNEDVNHRFLYWQIGDDKVIGPENNFNNKKYHYEVWSGRLFIKSIGSKEAGMYKCISKHTSNAGLNIQGVEVVVKQNWEEAYEEDPQANTYRAVIAILVLLIFAIIGGFAYFVKSRRNRNFTDLTREGSPDEGPSTRPQKTYNPTTVEITAGRPNRSLDNAIVETDIKTSFALTDYP